MPGFDIHQFQRGATIVAKGASSLSDILTLPPSRVAESVEPQAARSATFNPFRDPEGEQSPLDTPVPGDPTLYGVSMTPETYIPLTEEEIIAKAEAKTEWLAAFIAITSTVANAYVASQDLKKGDRAVLEKHEEEAIRTGSEPVYEPWHPYHKAKERVDEFTRQLKGIERRANLSEAQKGLIARAVVADIRAKDLRRRLRNTGVYGTAGEIMMTKLAEAAMALVVSLAAKFFIR